MPPTPDGAPLTEVIAFADELLDAAAFEDYSPNGLQVPGAEQVSTIASCVSAHLEAFRQARDAGAQLVIAHHGIFWGSGPQALSRPQAERLRLLLGSNIGLAQYHLPLDAHPEIGNNALIAEGLGCESVEPFGRHRGRPIGFAGRFAGEGLEADELFARVERLTAREPLVFRGGPERVRTLGIISGGAAGDVAQAVEAGLDAFLTGEPSEHVMADAIEGGLHFIAAGHYATETFGIRRLGDEIAARFGIRHVPLDIPNPV